MLSGIWTPSLLHPSGSNNCIINTLHLARREQWDMVVCDPPSFAPSKQAVETGRAAYERVFALAARVTRWVGG